MVSGAVRFAERGWPCCIRRNCLLKGANSFLILGKIGTTPYLLLTPANSTLVPLEDQKKLAQAAKNSRIEVIHGHGHEIFIDQAEVCQEKYLDFLGSLKN